MAIKSAVGVDSMERKCFMRKDLGEKALESCADNFDGLIDFLFGDVEWRKQANGVGSTGNREETGGMEGLDEGERGGFVG